MSSVSVAESGGLPTIPGYEILGKVGRGGRGVVYKARQVSLNRFVALKMIREDDHLSEAEGRALFRREAEAVARLQHPHIVQVYEFGEHAGRPYFSMELVEGESLKDKLVQGPLAAREAVELVETLARALHAVHQQGIIHRDLKPANVLLAAGHIPKVADFGLAKQVGNGVSLFASGAIVGTASYMAPEQAAGKLRQVGPPADVYALGAILYETLVGRPPFAGPTWWDTLDQVRTQDPVSPRRLQPRLPRDLETICLKCLHKDPTKRYGSAEELADRLRLFLAGRPIPDRPKSALAKSWHVARSHPLLSTAVVLVGLLTMTILIASHYLDPDRPRRVVKTSLAAGQPYVFAGHEQLPGPFRWVVGDAVPLRTNAVDECFSFQTLATGLLELAEDPGCERYRFSTEVRHDDSAGPSSVGLYFGFRQHQTVEGAVQRGFYTLSFADRGDLAKAIHGPDGAAVSWVLAQCCFCERPDYVPKGPIGKPKEFQPALPLGEPGPWRKLAVDVSPDGVEARWENDRGELEVINIPATKLERYLNDLKIPNPEMAAVPASFQPRAGLGLYVHRGEASFRRIMLEPLSSGE